MKRFMRLVLPMTALGLAMACGDDDEDDLGDELECLGVYAGWTEEQLDEATVAGGCEEDTEAICSRDLNADAGACAQACYAQHGNDTDAVIDCALECVKGGPKLDPGNSCLSCYLSSVLCAQQNCLNECLADTGSATCIACRADAGCTDAFLECSGLPDPADQPRAAR